MVDLITYVNRMPKSGETLEAPDFRLGFGGKGANQAVAAAILGADVAMITKIGDDLFGSHTKENFVKFGIDTSHVEVEKGTTSGVAPIFVEPDSSNRILIIKGANNHLRPEDVERAKNMIMASDLVLLQLETSLETVYYTIELCRKSRVRLVLNPAPAAHDLQLARIRDVDFLIPNENELEELTHETVETLDKVESAARQLTNAGIANVIVTIGTRGALCVGHHNRFHEPGVTVDSKDTTGAGDAFIGCFAVEYLKSKSIQLAVRRANLYAALSTTRPGTQTSFASRDEADEHFTSVL